MPVEHPVFELGERVAVRPVDEHEVERFTERVLEQRALRGAFDELDVIAIQQVACQRDLHAVSPIDSEDRMPVAQMRKEQRALPCARFDGPSHVAAGQPDHRAQDLHGQRARAMPVVRERRDEIEDVLLNRLHAMPL